MDSTVTEIARDTYRISMFFSDFRIQFNQFLVRDDEPFLMHTGFKSCFGATLAAVRSLIDPAKLRWVGFSHFESDECGALNEWLQVAPAAQAASSVVAARVNLGDFAIRPPHELADGEVLETGRHRLRFLATPHVPHGWDAGLFYDEVGQTLLCSDLFFHPGNPEPVTEADIVGRAKDAIQRGLAGPLANDMPFTPYTTKTLQRLAALAPATLALMHGSSFQGDGQAAILGLATVIKNLLGNFTGA